MSKWYARTCEVNRDGDIACELYAPTALLLAEKIKAEPPNHWSVWKDNGDGEGKVYKETVTTLFFSPGHERFGEMFSFDNQFGQRIAPIPTKEDW